jgi:hypothetical protein
VSDGGHEDLLALLTRRQILRGAGVTGLAAIVGAALPLVHGTPLARAASPSVADATMQAFADTILPGRRVVATQSGRPIDPRAIAGVDPLPGAVEADALALFSHPDVGFGALEPAFLADVEGHSLSHGGPFLDLPFPTRVQVCLAGLDPANPTFLAWEAAAAIPFTAFCAAALVLDATRQDACGYRVMGLPGAAPDGYRGYSWRLVLSHERTRAGSLP